MDLKELVEREGQAEVAQAADCSQSLISRILKGERNLTPKRAKRLAAVFEDVSMRSLLPDLYDEGEHA